MSSIGFTDEGAIELERLRARLRKMDDEELRRFGKAAAFMCSPGANFNKPPREEFVIQLEEARKQQQQPPNPQGATSGTGQDKSPPAQNQQPDNTQGSSNQAKPAQQKSQQGEKAQQKPMSKWEKFLAKLGCLAGLPPDMVEPLEVKPSTNAKPPKDSTKETEAQPARTHTGTQEPLNPRGMKAGEAAGGLPYAADAVSCMQVIENWPEKKP